MEELYIVLEDVEGDVSVIKESIIRNINITEKQITLDTLVALCYENIIIKPANFEKAMLAANSMQREIEKAAP